jgi:putative SOS response-associated peptidase YedK
MCARYSIGFTEKQVRDLFNLEEDEHLEARYNVAPTQDVPAVIEGREDHKRHLVNFRWGLVPYWADDVKIGQKLINARSETIFEKSAFKNAARRHRCLIPAMGFYEWRTEGKKKQPYYFRLKSGKPMAFAGLYEVKRMEGDDRLRTCTIVTCEPNELVRPFHDRMPALVREEDFDGWLSKSVEAPKELLPILVPFPQDEMECYAVSPTVNKVDTEGAQCIVPIELNGGDETPSLF